MLNRAGKIPKGAPRNAWDPAALAMGTASTLAPAAATPAALEVGILALAAGEAFTGRTVLQLPQQGQNICNEQDAHGAAGRAYLFVSFERPENGSACWAGRAAPPAAAPAAVAAPAAAVPGTSST